MPTVYASTSTTALKNRYTLRQARQELDRSGDAGLHFAMLTPVVFEQKLIVFSLRQGGIFRLPRLVSVRIRQYLLRTGSSGIVS